MGLIKVSDEFVAFVKYRVSNVLVCCILSSAQLVVSVASLGQHIYSMIYFDRKVFFCTFGNSTSAAHQSQYLQFDIIIYDFRLFHRMWGIDKCIANYMDGGYMRFLWCVGQVLVLLTFLLTCLLVAEPRPMALKPMIFMQTFYSIGLLVLTVSAVPKFLPSLLGNVDRETVLPILIYLFGLSLNFFLTYILWHYYWHLCSLNERHRRRVVDKNRITASNDDENRTLLMKNTLARDFRSAPIEDV